ncbi:hypothetical protein D3877_24010 [Azospirillum cavernae]|uniref:Uncharacterized protein n=1 Tax=Azospirillum cavernae TaxID=2320860 RepID=A0A418VPJ1_9PROT|nr:hypothetical protein [Azospirillum cavernae]RJF78185.1 hypothetical protein D3877_24010 [Azospirillum cavernae]
MSDADQNLEKRLKERLETLRAEYRAGQEQLAALDTRRADLQTTMLRIAGAIQVLEETLAVPADKADA